jgi:hypothetical protein
MAHKTLQTQDHQLAELVALVGEMLANEKRAREDTERLRPFYEGTISADCIEWLTAEASAETWHCAAALVAHWLAQQPQLAREMQNE